MIFWILLALAVGFWVLSAFVDWDDGARITAVVFTIFTAIMAVFILCTHLTAEGTRQSNLQRQNAIEYKIESKIYYDSFGIKDQDIVDQISNWNEDLVFNQTYQRDFWVGIFIPNIYDEFKLFTYDNLKQ